jgi:hypothetical protein
MELGLPKPDDLRALWAQDEGSPVRDVYVEGTTSADWQMTVESIQERWPCSYTEDGEAAAMPSAVEAAAAAL